MKENYEFEQLLTAYFLKELSADQEAFVINTVNINPELRKLFNEYERLWRLLGMQKNLEEIDVETERQLFHNKLKEHRLKKAVIESEDESFEVQEEIRPSKVYRLWKAIAVAASIIIVISFGWMPLRNKPVDSRGIAKETQKVKAAPQSYAQTETNTSGKIRVLLLEDGTEVQLWDGSEISYSNPFTGDKRDIILRGKANFKVAKDSTKPFTVYSGAITTTALGTEFLITNYEREKTITVRLVEGRVVVNSVDTAARKLKQPYYLNAGQELIYNKQKASVVIRNFRSGLRDGELVKDNPSLPKASSDSWYMFNNRPLPEIFDELETMFDVKIDYKKKELEKIYFIGQFDKSDSLEYILRNIAALNNLAVLKTNDQYLIRKKNK